MFLWGVMVSSSFFQAVPTVLWKKNAYEKYVCNSDVSRPDMWHVKDNSAQNQSAKVSLTEWDESYGETHVSLKNK